MNTAMIFAAGRGERLKPLTDTCPKAMCKIHNIPLIEYHVQHLAAAGIENIIINHAHLGDMIRKHLGNGERWHVNILYSPEPPGALETGGAIINARHLLGDKPFITVNADIFTDFDFATLSVPKDKLAHLILVNQPSYYAHADFGLKKNGELSLDNKQYTFAGIACYHPAFFTPLSPGRFSVTPHIKKRIPHHQISGTVFNGTWIDIGSPERLQLANQGDSITGSKATSASSHASLNSFSSF
jgi:MurNAc alpha-1-phosphate uridylyltransferase